MGKRAGDACDGGGDTALTGRVGALERVYGDLSALVGRVVAVLKGIGAALGG